VFFYGSIFIASFLSQEFYVETLWNYDINADLKNNILAVNHSSSEAAKGFEIGKIHHIYNDLHT